MIRAKGQGKKRPGFRPAFSLQHPLRDRTAEVPCLRNDVSGRNRDILIKYILTTA